jgi:hypothetical protein
MSTIGVPVGERLLGRAGEHDAKALGPEDVLDRAAHVGIVIEHEDVWVMVQPASPRPGFRGREGRVNPHGVSSAP